MSRELRLPRTATPAQTPALRDTDAGLFLEELREHVVQRLGMHYAMKDLSTAELRRRLALALGATTPDLLDLLLADLPPLELPIGPDQAARPPVTADPVPERGIVVAFMGGSTRRGPWVVPRRLKVTAIMGGVELDLRGARFAPGVTEFEVLAVMGGVDIHVPPGVRVETVGMAVMGGFEADAGDVSPLDDQRPVLRISGLAVMGGVEASTKRPQTKALANFAGLLAKARKRAGRT
jgi:hypothetical protein